jgi:hypothetical protein
LKRAMDFIRDFEHKLVTRRCADDLVAHVTKNNAFERTADKPAVRSA